MRSIGGLMFFFGVGSIVLHFMERNFTVLSWIDNWGPNVAWAIRIGFAVVGGGLWLAGGKSDDK